MSEVKQWDLKVIKAWLARNSKEGERRHPPRADKIYRRYRANIERVEAWAKQERPKRWWEE